MKEWIKEIGVGFMMSGIFFFSLFGPNILKEEEAKKPEMQFETVQEVSRESPEVLDTSVSAELPHVTAVKAETVKEAPIEVPENIVSITENVGERYNICPEFLQAIAWRESRFDETAVNASGTCYGVMQVSEKWHSHRMEAGENLLDPETNIRVAAEYLSELFERYEDPAIVLMIYNGDSRWKNEWYISSYAEEILEMANALEK